MKNDEMNPRERSMSFWLNWMFARRKRRHRIHNFTLLGGLSVFFAIVLCRVCGWL